MSGRAEKFKGDLETYRGFRRTCDGLELNPGDVDFEEFLGFLDVEFYLGLRGSETWSDDGNETQVMIKTLIGQILSERTPSPTAVPQLYLRFAKGLQPDDVVVTFNYDILLERALRLIGKPFRLFPTRLKQVGGGSPEVDTSGEDVVILKLHGSMDWFDRKQYREMEEAWTFQGFQGRPDDPIFNRPDVRVSPVVDGPRFPNDPLQEMYRVHDVETVYRNPPMFRAAPWLLNPSAMKLLYAITVKDFWTWLGGEGVVNLGMVIIGYSLPAHDDYARQVIYRIVRRYQSQYWNEGFLGRRKSPLVLVDFCRTMSEREDLKQRYAFVDWDKTRCYFDGFSEDVLPALFPDME